jgi:hyperosmotically inducible protein
MRKIPNLVVVCLLAASSGCSSMLLGNGQSAGRPIGADTRTESALASDRRISALILNRYSADDELSGQGLRVSTRRGVVTLSGALDSYPLRDRAVRLARDVQGVERINNQIVIKR